MTAKNVLIVTGSNYSEVVYQGFKRAKEMGLQLYLLSDGSFQPNPGYFEEHFTADLRKTAEVLKYMPARPVHFDAVTIKTSEWLTPLTALLARKYGCIGNSPLTAFNCRSKYHMRRELQKGGVPIPKFALCRTYSELETAVHEIGIPAIAKPVGGNASYGTFLIMNTADLDYLKERYEKSIAFLKKKALAEDVFGFEKEEMDLIGIKEHVDMVTDYLVEEYMAGPEISIDALVQDGKVTIMGIEDQIRMAPPYVMQTGARLPYVCDQKKEKEIYDLVCLTIKAMGIENSATHSEIIFTPEGGKIVEIGCRIGGDDLHDTIFEVTGYNLMFESIMIALGIKREYHVKTLCHTSSQFILAHKEGQIKEIHLPHNLQGLNVYDLTLSAKVGDHVSLPPKDFDYLGYLCAKGETPQEAKKNTELAMKKVIIKIE